MTIARGLAAALAILVALGAGVRADAADGADAAAVQPPTTLWNYLGIPQGFHKVQDARLNRTGNRPDRERTPALKQIADPANLQSPNPAIKAAAKIKADADLAPQKVKAIKYLATICCGCAKNKDDVKEALLAALDDCTEEVRYEAAMALCQCAGNPCTICNSSGCCDAKVMNKMLKVSEGKDEQGCWLESSARVRAVAANALAACQQVRGPSAAAKVETLRKGEAPELPSEATPLPGKKAAEPTTILRKVPAADTSTGDEQGVAPAGFVEIQDGVPAKPAQDGPSVSPAGSRPARATWTSEVRFQGRIIPSATR